MLHSEFLSGLHRDRLRIRLVALLPENKRWINLQLLRDDCPESKDRLLVCGFVGLHRHSLDLSAGAIADIESRRDLPGSAWGDLVLLSLRGGATTGSVNRLKMHRRASGVLIFEMAYCLFVGGRWMQLECSLLPFQFRACAKADDDRQDKSNDVCFHFLE